MAPIIFYPQNIRIERSGVPAVITMVVQRGGEHLCTMDVQVPSTQHIGHWLPQAYAVMREIGAGITEHADRLLAKSTTVPGPAQPS